MKKIRKLLNPDVTQEETDKIMREMLSTKFDQDLRTRLESKLKDDYQVHRTVTSQEPYAKQRPSNLKKLISIAALFGLIVTGGYFIFQSLQPNETTTQQYLAANQIKYHNINRASGNSTESAKQNAYNLFNKGDYQSAATLLSGINNLSSEDKFYQAYSLVRIHKIDSALILLTELNETLGQNDHLGPETRLYLAICLKESNAQNQLNELLESFVEGSWETKEFAKLK